MFNPIPKIFGTEYDDGFSHTEWASKDLIRHIETVNALGYVPAMVSLASSILGRDLEDEFISALKKHF
jgi:hypothetical protein